MKDMLAFLITRDTMHQNQWLAVLEELGGPTENLPIPNTFPMERHVAGFDYAFVSTNLETPNAAEGRWTSGRSIDGKGEFSIIQAQPGAPRPDLGAPDVKGYAQAQQMMTPDKGLLDNISDTIMP